MEQYLKQVQENNPEIKSIDLAISASENKIQELDMVYSSFFNANYGYMLDKSGPGFGSTLPMEKLSANMLNLNYSKKLKTGTSISAGYSNTSADINLTSPTDLLGNGNKLSSFSSSDMKPFVGFSQSLLRDFNSGVTQTGIDKVKKANKAGQYMQIFKKQQLLLKAKTVYWGLSLSREILSFRSVSLERAKKIVDWNENKLKLDLVEKSDYLQSQAAYKMRQLNLQMSVEDEIRAAKDFNELRGDCCSTVTEQLTKIADVLSVYENISTLSFEGQRADILAGKALYESALAAQKETSYRALPELSFSGNVSAHGLGFTSSEAWNQVSDFSKPAYSFGLNLIIPLDYKTLNTVKKGYAEDFESSKAFYDKARLSQKNDWDQLLRNWTNVKERINLAKEIQKIQNDRVSNEQARFEKGRTTTFLLLNAQNDLDDATINLYRLIYEQIVTFAQVDLYNTKQ